MANDLHKFNNESAQSPARGAFDVTPADSDMTTVAKALYIGGAGDVAVRMADGSDVTFVGVGAGALLPVQALQVRAATTATNIVALI